MDAVRENTVPHAGPNLFPDTRWSLVLRARDKSGVSLGTLCQQYRVPLIVWLRCHGYSIPDSEDLVQGFIEHVLANDLLKTVRPDKGKFRTFFLTCFRNYVEDQRGRANAEKRGGGLSHQSLEELAETGHHFLSITNGVQPDVAYDRAWAQVVLETALRRLETECASKGHQELCAELQPVMFDDEGGASYGEIGKRLAMSVGAVRTAAHRIRARLKALIREEVQQTVASREDLTEELQHLVQLLTR